jgi:hypothetical protein
MRVTISHCPSVIIVLSLIKNRLFRTQSENPMYCEVYSDLHLLISLQSTGITKHYEEMNLFSMVRFIQKVMQFPPEFSKCSNVSFSCK